ncbi:unnamed protein product [Prunus armeniaca]|uniref:Cyclic nucleotide-binding domain-containing protein n=1 Tax=Prunus armeniaca TaxID=36596 RepID=A0A6J5VJK0_PRUAR|nr:unnamed protein product [Prunus armeniaca]
MGFEGESSKLKEDGGHRSISSAAPNPEEVVKPKIFLRKWDIIFTVSSALAVFVDPLSCYIPIIVDNSACYYWDPKLVWTFFALRSVGDLFYAMDIFVFLRRSRSKGNPILVSINRRRGNGNAKPFGASWMKFFGGPDSTICKVLNGQKSLRFKSLRFLGILSRICAALPILQAIILTGKYTYFGSIYGNLFYLIPIQYTLRAYNLYQWLDRHANIETTVKRLLKYALDFLPFILAAHGLLHFQRIFTHPQTTTLRLCSSSFSSNPSAQLSAPTQCCVNLDEEGESSKLKEDGGHTSTSSAAAKGSKQEEVVNNAYQIHQQPKKLLPKWEIIFTVASAFAVFVDPLSCYVPVIIDDSTCYYWDQTLMWTFLALRSAGDLFYGMDVLVFIKRRSNVNAKPFGASWTKHFGGHDSRIWKVLNGQKSLRFLGILPRICAALPILQAIIFIGKYTYLDNSNLFYLIPIQYTLRAHNLYRWLDQHANLETAAVKRLLKAALDFLPFILTAHLFGALWYFFAVDRKMVCWQEHICKIYDVCARETRVYFFYCSSFTPENNMMFNVSRLHEACAVQLSANVTSLPFDYGIYLYALQSNMTSSRDLPVKMLQCIWWGLRNLSSFGSNLQTSFFKDEIIFSIVISISGLALFLVYLNSRVQGSKKVSNQLKLQQKIETIYPDIIEQMRNNCSLGLASLKKMPLLESTDEKVLKAICEYLKPVTYGEDVYIIREGEPLRKMFFITRGTALTYTTIKGGTNVCKCLEKSDFYGEELLNWAFKFCSFSELPISTTNLISQTKVEAFSIRANHLKSIVAQFWWHFQRKLPRSQLEHFAASSIQAFWRRRRAKAKGPTRWDKLTLN